MTPPDSGKSQQWRKHACLDQKKPEYRERDQCGRGQDDPQIRLHAYRHEEQSQQQAFVGHGVEVVQLRLNRLILRIGVVRVEPVTGFISVSN